MPLLEMVYQKKGLENIEMGKNYKQAHKANRKKLLGIKKEERQ